MPKLSGKPSNKSNKQYFCTARKSSILAMTTFVLLAADFPTSEIVKARTVTFCKFPAQIVISLHNWVRRFTWVKERHSALTQIMIKVHHYLCLNAHEQANKKPDTKYTQIAKIKTAYKTVVSRGTKLAINLSVKGSWAETSTQSFTYVGKTQPCHLPGPILYSISWSY